MHSNNQLELDRILEDLASIRSCITNFTGYVLGGSGVLATVLAFASATQVKAYQIGFASFFGSLVISLVMLVLFYKFTSHNRMAAFLKAMSHEDYDLTGQATSENTSIIIWDICIGRLMHYAKHGKTARDTRDSTIRLCARTNYRDLSETEVWKLSTIFYCLTLQPSPIDKGRIYKGIWTLLKTYAGRLDSQSWSYVSYITAVFFTIVAAFLVAGVFATYFSCNPEVVGTIHAQPVAWLQFLSTKFNCTPVGKHVIESQLLLLVCILTLVTQAIIWGRFLAKLHSLMLGSSTVDAYFWRFLVIRGRVLSQHGYGLKYSNLRSWLGHTFDMVEKQLPLSEDASKNKIGVKTCNSNFKPNDVVNNCPTPRMIRKERKKSGNPRTARINPGGRRYQSLTTWP